MAGFYTVVLIGFIVIIYFSNLNKNNYTLSELSAFDLINKDVSFFKSYGFKQKKIDSKKSLYVKYNRGLTKEITCDDGIVCKVEFWQSFISKPKFDQVKRRHTNLAANMHLFPSRKNNLYYTNNSYDMVFNNNSITLHKKKTSLTDIQKYLNSDFVVG